MQLHKLAQPIKESAIAVLAKNLVMARIAAGLTQQELAAAADVARATIAQLEAGLGDPRLSTVTALADALGVSPSILLAGQEQVKSMAALCSQTRISVPASDRARMQELLNSGLLKDRVRAGRVGAAAARRAGLSERAVVHAGIFSAFDAAHGVTLAAALVDSAAPPVTQPHLAQNVTGSPAQSAVGGAGDGIVQSAGL